MSATVQTKHTPGPWTVEDPMDFELWIVQDGKETYEWFPIASCAWPDEDHHFVTNAQVKANASLIAAAPDLLTNLRGTVAALVAIHGEPPAIFSESDEARRPSLHAAWRSILAARAAIAKAEGRT